MASQTCSLAPRARDGKPDLSGIWSNPGWREIAGSGVSGTGGAPGTPAVLPRGPGLFFDIGSGVPGGLPFQPSAAALKKQRMADNMKDNPDAHCLPMGNMQLHTHPQPRKIVQTSDVIVILYEGNAGIRQLFTDGRPLPKNDPSALVVRLLHRPMGRRHAGDPVERISRWRVARREREPVDRRRHGDRALHARELRQPDDRDHGGRSEGVYRPWSVTVNQQIMLDTELIEFVCLENEQSTKHFR